MSFDRIVIIGVGLLGASFARAVKTRNICRTIGGYSRNTETLERAHKKGILDHYSADLISLCRDADLILLATPVGTFRQIASQLGRSLRKGALMTDVGSVKGRLVYDLESLMPDGVHYVGSHPIAGSERSGMHHADPDLFKGNRCIVTPTDKTDPSALETIKTLWRRLGAEVVTMSPEEHDRVFGAVSHLPHIVAYELVNTADALDTSYLRYSGKGLRDMTRIASSSPELWSDVCVHNRENLVEALDLLIERLERVRDHVQRADRDRLREEFEQAKALRDRIGQD